MYIMLSASFSKHSIHVYCHHYKSLKTFFFSLLLLLLGLVLYDVKVQFSFNAIYLYVLLLLFKLMYQVCDQMEHTL